MQLEQVLIKPLITEKSAVASENYNRYGFVVNTKANKFQIKEAVQKFYDVKVLSVKTNLTPGRIKRFGMVSKKTPKFKKAYVQLEAGQKIEFFKGV